jgi:hypothetical protein
MERLDMVPAGGRCGLALGVGPGTLDGVFPARGLSLGRRRLILSNASSVKTPFSRRSSSSYTKAIS